MKRPAIYFLLISCILAYSCRQTAREKQLNGEKLRDAALNAGEQISNSTQMVLGSTLKQKIEEQGVPQAIQYCNLNAYPLVDSLESVYGAEIRRATHRARNPDDNPDEKEAEVIRNYMNQISQGETPTSRVVIKEEVIHFYKPIILSSPLCLNCHGETGTDISEENYTIIKSLYPEDNATGHQMGDLRGIWSISLDKESLRNF